MSVFRSSRTISAAPEAVFAAVENPTRLARWWGPNGFSNTFHPFEFRDGGSWLFTMHGPDGQDHPKRSSVSRNRSKCHRQGEAHQLTAL